VLIDAVHSMEDLMATHPDRPDPNDPRLTDPLNPIPAPPGTDPRVDDPIPAQARGSGSTWLMRLVVLVLAIVAYYIFGRSATEAPPPEQPAASQSAPAPTEPAAPMQSAPAEPSAPAQPAPPAEAPTMQPEQPPAETAPAQPAPAPAQPAQ